MHLIEPYLAFDDPDYALETVLARQPWPKRPGKHWFTEVRKLANSEADRNSHLWSKVASDPQYRQLARGMWREGFAPSEDPPPDELKKTIERADRARGPGRRQTAGPRRQGAVRAHAERG